MLTGDHGVQGDNYLYAGIEAMRKNPKAPYAIVYTAPILAFAGSMVINKNTQNPHAAALMADWALSDEAQKANQRRAARATGHQASVSSGQHQTGNLQYR